MRPAHATTAQRLWLLIAAVAVLGVAMAILGSGSAPSASLAAWPSWWALFALFAVAEIKVIHLYFRRAAHSLSLSEIPLLLGLVFAGPVEVIAARVLGSAVALVFYRRQRGAKLALNLANYVLETSVAAVLYYALLGNHTPVGSMGWRAAYVALLTSSAVAAVVVAIVISIVENRSLGHLLRGVLPAGVVASGTNISLALAAVTLAWFQPTSLWLIAVVSATVFLAYQAYTRLRQKHSSLELLYDFSCEVGQAHDFEAVVGTLLQRAAQMSRAHFAELILLPSGGQSRGLRVSRYDEAEPVVVHALEEELAGDLALALVQDGQARLLPRSSKDPEVRTHLRRMGVADAVLAPMNGGENLLGVLVAGDTLDHTRTFDDDDVRMLETLANHASVALQNGRLVHRLRLEAAEKEYQSLHDALTGLANRSLFHRRVDRAVASARLHGTGGSVLLIDLDRFKEVNDTLGHHVGDALLRELSARLRQTVGERGTIARLGGDEFGILLPRTASAEDAQRFAQRLCHAIEEPIVVDDLDLEVGASIGIAVYPEHGDDAVTLLQRADVAMYSAKARRDGVQLYAFDRDSNSLRRLSLVSELRKALDEGEIAVHYQPQIELATGTVVGVEALARWTHPHLGAIPPDEFIAVAEHTGLIRRLTRYVLAAALRQARAWHLAGLDVGVAVNLSPRALLDNDLPEAVELLLSETGVDAERLTLELTESGIMADPTHAIGLLSRLSGLGIKLSIDDFGTGYSSLSYLKRLPVDELKIDRSFVHNMTQDASDAAIVRSTIELAHNLGLEVVAEGIEDGATLAALAALGCDFAQGYLMSRPLAAARIEEWLTVWQGQRDALRVTGEAGRQDVVRALRPRSSA